MPLPSRNRTSELPAAPAKQERLSNKTLLGSEQDLLQPQTGQLKLSSQPGGARCARPNKACLTICLVFTLYTVSLVEPLLVTAMRVPEAFQLAEREAESSHAGYVDRAY